MAVNEMLAEGRLVLPYCEGAALPAGRRPDEIDVQVEHCSDSVRGAAVTVVTEGCTFSIIGLDPAGLRGLARMLQSAADRLEVITLTPLPGARR